MSSNEHHEQIEYLEQLLSLESDFQCLNQNAICNIYILNVGKSIEL